MNGKLKKNICKLDDHVFISKVEDLPICRTTYIGDALKYACHFWTNHLMGIPGNSPSVEEVQKAITKFFKECLLFWIETLSLMGALNVGVHALNDVQ